MPVEEENGEGNAAEAMPVDEAEPVVESPEPVVEDVPEPEADSAADTSSTTPPRRNPRRSTRTSTPSTNAPGSSSRGRSRSRSRSRDAKSKKPSWTEGKTAAGDRPSTGNPTKLTSDDLVGRTVLLKTRDDGQRFRAEIVEVMDQFESNRLRNPELVKFRCRVGDAKAEEIVAYNEMMGLIEEQVRNEDGNWRFRQIKGHTEGPSPKVLIEWESGEVTLEPVCEIAKFDRYVLAEYARDNDLIEKWDDRWPSLKLRQAAKNAKTLIRAINAAKRSSYKSAPVYMFGHRVPRNHDEAMELDKANGNTKWKDSELLERNQLLEYNTFKDLGHRTKARAPPGYKRITLHYVYAVKHDGRYKSRIVAGGHLTDAPVESVYSGVVSLRGIRFVLFLSELNGLETYQTDVGNAYLESYTKEKVCHCRP